MMRALRAALAAGSLFLLSFSRPPAISASGPEGLSIEHVGASCIVAERYARIRARVIPSEAATRVQVYFKTPDSSAWYFVEMTPEGDRFAGTLPKPKKQTKQINYYVDAISAGLGESRTGEYAPMVLGAGECAKKGLGLEAESFERSSRVAVGSPPGSPSVPPGFSSSGVVPFTAAAADARTRAKASAPGEKKRGEQAQEKQAKRKK